MCCLCWVFSHLWPQTLLCYYLPCSSLYLFASSDAMGSATKSLLPGLPLGVLNSTFSSAVTPFSCGFSPFHPLTNAVRCCLSASVCPQRPCAILFFWISPALSYFSELSFHSFMYFYSVLFILASRYVRMMSCFGLKSFKSSANVIRDKLSLQIHFLLSIRQIGLVFSHMVSISYSGETRPTCVWGTGHWAGV